MALRLKKKKKVKGFEVKKGRVEIPYGMSKNKIEKDKQDKFERAYRVDERSLAHAGKVKIVKRRGEKYDPSEEERKEKLRKVIKTPSKNEKSGQRIDRARRKKEQDIKTANNERVNPYKYRAPSKKKYVEKEGVDPTKPPKAKIVKQKKVIKNRAMEIEARKKKFKKSEEKKPGTKMYLKRRY